MNAAILYRFYRDIDSVAERLKILRYFNPTLPIFGLFGGDDFASCKPLGPLLDDLRMFHGRKAEWKWLHAEGMISQWYREYGYSQCFDVLLDHEWDIVYTAPLAQVYPGAGRRTVALSGLVRMNDVVASWQWTSASPWRQPFLNYCQYMAQQFGMGLQTYVCQAPGWAFGRDFVDALAAQSFPNEVFDRLNCEITVPGFAQALGFDIIDTGLHGSWTPHISSNITSPYFHCMNVSIEPQSILKEMAKPVGVSRRHAFHPVKDMIRADAVVSAAQEHETNIR